MTSNYHTPHSFGAPLTSAEVNAPLSELDTQVTRLTRFFLATAYGAAANGTTDDTTALQAAIAAAVAAGGGTVVLPPGICKITVPLTITASNVSFVGEGMGVSIIYNAGTGNAFTLGFQVSSIQYLNFTDLSVHGNTASAAGFAAEAVVHMNFTRCEIYGHGTWGVLTTSVLAPVNRVTFVSCRIHDNYATDATLGNGGGVKIGQQCEQFWFYGTSIRSVYGAKRTKAIGILILDYVNGVTIYGGDITTMGRGVSISGGVSSAARTSSIIVRGVYFEDNDTGVRASASDVSSPVTNLVIEDNGFSAQSANAIDLQIVDGVSVKGNEVRNSAGGFLTMNSNPVNVAIGQNSAGDSFSGTMYAVTAGTPRYWYAQPQRASKRVSAGSITAGATVDVTVTWDAPFADTNYTVVATVLHATATALFQWSVKSFTASAAIISVKNLDASSRTPTVHAMAIHDS